MDPETLALIGAGIATRATGRGALYVGSRVAARSAPYVAAGLPAGLAWGVHRRKNHPSRMRVHRKYGPSQVPKGYREQKPGEYEKYKQSQLPYKHKKSKGEKPAPPPPRDPPPTNTRKVPTRRKTPEFAGDAMDTKVEKAGRRLTMPYVPGGLFRRARRKVTIPLHKYHYEDHGVVTRTNVAYVGCNAIGGFERALRPVAAALLAKLLKRMQSTVSNHDAAIKWIDIPTLTTYKLQIGFYNDRSDGSVAGQDLHDVLTLAADTSFNALVNALANKMYTSCVTGNEYGYYPSTLRIVHLTNSADIKGQLIDLDNLLVGLSCTQRIDIQNQSTSDANNKDKHQIDNNPIKGKRYHFKNPYPEKRDSVTGQLPFDKIDTVFEQGMLNTGVDTDDIYTVTPTATTYNPLFAPPNGVSIWKNCTTQASISLRPGEHKKFSTVFRFRGYLKTLMLEMGKFLAKTGQTYNSHGNRLGYSVLFGFEPTIRTGDETITLALQKEQHTSASVRFAKKPALPMKHNIGGTLSV